MVLSDNTKTHKLTCGPCPMQGPGAGNKNQGEGWAFYKVIGGYVAKKDAAGAFTLNGLYDMKTINKSPRNYCTGLNILLKILP